VCWCAPAFRLRLRWRNTAAVVGILAVVDLEAAGILLLRRARTRRVRTAQSLRARMDRQVLRRRDTVLAGIICALVRRFAGIRLCIRGTDTATPLILAIRFGASDSAGDLITVGGPATICSATVESTTPRGDFTVTATTAEVVMLLEITSRRLPRIPLPIMRMLAKAATFRSFI
jgi:hypothetical protein